MTLKDLLTWHDETYVYHSPLQPKDQTSAEIDRLKTLVSELEDKVKELAKGQKSNEGCEEEPLIKDEKIRKAVRAWTEANDLLTFKVVNEHFDCFKIIGYGDHNISSRIEFKSTIAHANKDQFYTIAELCGEEEE